MLTNFQENTMIIEKDTRAESFQKFIIKKMWIGAIGKKYVFGRYWVSYISYEFQISLFTGYIDIDTLKFAKCRKIVLL